MSAPMSFAVVERVHAGTGSAAPTTIARLACRRRPRGPRPAPDAPPESPRSSTALPPSSSRTASTCPVTTTFVTRYSTVELINSYRIADFRAGPAVYSQTRLLALRSSLFGVARTKSRVARRLATDKFTTLAQPLQRNARRHLSRRCLTHRQRVAWPYDSGSTHAQHPRPLRTPPCGAPMDDPHDGQYRRLRGMLAPPPSSDRDQ